MRSKYGLTDIDADHRTLLETLSGLMNRANNSGTPLVDILKGKLQYIKDKGLNLQVKFQSDHKSGDVSISGGESADNQSVDGKPSWDWIKQEMEDGEDVLLWFKYYDPNANSGSGKWFDHKVTLTDAEMPQRLPGEF